MKVSFRDATKMKGDLELAKKYSLKKFLEFCQNGCKMLTIETSPMDYGLMGIVWSYFRDSGMYARALGSKAKNNAHPYGPGGAREYHHSPAIYKTLHIKILAKMEFLSMPDVANLFKKVEGTIKDSSRPHRKFTCL